MNAGSRGLGRGLDALFRHSSPAGEDTAPLEYQYINIELIHSNPHQPRKAISEEALEELAGSIRTQGLLQPILVRPGDESGGSYQIVAGERRWRASLQAGLQHVPAIVSSLTDSEAMVVSLIENLQREDLNPMEEAEALQRIQSECELSQDLLSQKLGKSRSSVANCLRLLQLEPEIREAVREGRISAGQARTLLSINEDEARTAVFHMILEKGLTVRQIEEIAAYWREHRELPRMKGEVRSGGRRPRDRDFETFKKRLQQEIASRLDAPVRIQGQRDRGSITLRYQSQEELEELLRKLGVQEER
jgi:ParB family chromosome partitioning protein